MPKKFVYFYGGGDAEGNGSMKEILGGKGAGLHEMSKIGLPVPPGFTISIDSCAEYYNLGRKMPPGLQDEVKAHLKKLEKLAGKKLGDSHDPLLVSVRSGAARSMPGMMETILNLGLNDASVEGLAKKTNNPRFAYDAYRRFIQMYSTTAMGLSKEPMEKMLEDTKHRLGIKSDPEIPAEDLKKLCGQFKEFYRQKKGSDFPQDPMDQLWGAVMAVFNSWEAEKAVTYRRVEKITELRGTGVNIVQMVFGNMGESSGTGVCFTRDPNSGENEFYGDMLINAQGEDVVAGIRTPLKLIELHSKMPAVYKQLCAVRSNLEKHFKEMQDIEFTIENEKLYVLQCRTGKRTPEATFRIAVDMVAEKLITKEEAVMRISPEDIERLFYPVIDPRTDKKTLADSKLATGINAVPGAATGEVVFTAAEAEQLAGQGHKLILVRKETCPEDVGGMHSSQGILTATGGKTSHAAVVARGWGKCCIVGCDALDIDYEKKKMTVGGRTIKQGDFITLNGSTGEVFIGKMALVKPEFPQSYNVLMGWADEIRTLKVRTNADTPEDSAVAIRLGAQGIGLTRTEHMFFATEERRLAFQEMIVANTREERRKALAKLLPFQRDDFYGIFKAMNGYPVTIRLIDPPLHEFTPKDDAGISKLSKITGQTPDAIRHRCEQLHEANPMLGHRGCRLCITYPEILEMQVTAIVEAAVKFAKEGGKVFPEIMIPLTLDAKEYRIQELQARKVADDIIAKSGVKLDYLVGTMIEIPRAALMADKIAEYAEFFSFGTNDLTQTTMGISRDDGGRFLPTYVATEKDGGAGIFKDDPFQVLDFDGVGQLVKMGIERGRSTRKHLKVGICGEHGGEAKSVKFCHAVGMNYVSCSPYRVPIARLAAAQAAITHGDKQPKDSASPKKTTRKSKEKSANA
ncbi:MAG: pyruvate, phosphate dikinase [Candidatus Wallbacteria bacterium]|nr:pyruvate, phosphate dikinase [Candidatus Wallbacteria bacterium]